ELICEPGTSPRFALASPMRVDPTRRLAVRRTTIWTPQATARRDQVNDKASVPSAAEAEITRPVSEEPVLQSRNRYVKEATAVRVDARSSVEHADANRCLKLTIRVEDEGAVVVGPVQR